MTTNPPTIASAVRTALADATLLAVARAVAALWSRNPLHDGVVPDLCSLTLYALSLPAYGGVGALSWGDAMRSAPEEQARVTAALVAMGTLVKVGRGSRARYQLAPHRPRSERVAEALAAELAATGRCEASLPWLAGKSAALALLGLEGAAAWDAMARLCRDVPGWHYGTLAGVDRVLLMAATQAPTAAGAVGAA